MNNLENQTKIVTDSSVTVVFFDGICNLCNWFVDFLIVRDTNRVLRFAPLQGKTAKERLGRFLVDNSAANGDPDSIVVAAGTTILVRSDAALHVLTKVGGGWAMVARILQFFPRFLRDGIYRVVASVRYRLFGRRDSCRVPSPDERESFLP